MKVAYTIFDKEKQIKVKPAEDGWEVVFEGYDTLKPLFDYVLVEKDEEKTTTNGGLVLPDSLKEKPSTGTVVAVGDGQICEQTGVISPMYVKVGDRIIFPKLCGQTVKVNGEEKTLLKQTSILSIMK